MAEGLGNTQFNNILQELEQDLTEAITPALDQASAALEQLVAEARERVTTSAADMRLLLEETLALSVQIRAELETFERGHTQVAAHSQTQLEGVLPPFAEFTDSLQSASSETVAATTELETSFPGFSEAAFEASGKLAGAGNTMQEQVETGSADADAAVTTLETGVQEGTAAVEQSLAALAQSCAGLNDQASQLASTLSAQTVEQLAGSAEELRSGVRDAAQAAETAAALVLDGLEVFQGASEQLERVFGEDTEEVMGSVRQIASLIEAIRPFIEIAKNI